MKEWMKTILIVEDIELNIDLPARILEDGYETTRNIRKTFQSLSIIGLSAHAMQGDDEKAKTSGCTGYLTKPVDEVLLPRKLMEYPG